MPAVSAALSLALISIVKQINPTIGLISPVNWQAKPSHARHSGGVLFGLGCDFLQFRRIP